MKFYTYIFRDPSRNNEAIYVGKGCQNRAYKHLSRSDIHPFTQRLQLMKQSGVEPDIEIIHCNNEEVAFAAEVLSIKILGRKDLGKGTLLNLTNGGEGSSNPSPEARQKLSDAKKGENNPYYGKSHTLETRKKMSDALKGENSHNYGKSPSTETRLKLSGATKGIPKPRVTCPHCRKEGGEGIMRRWHFDNCKTRK